MLSHTYNAYTYVLPNDLERDLPLLNPLNYHRVTTVPVMPQAPTPLSRRVSVCLPPSFLYLTDHTHLLPLSTYPFPSQTITILTMSITTSIGCFNRIITVLSRYLLLLVLLLLSAVAAAAINSSITTITSSLDSGISLSDIKEEVKNYICPGEYRVWCTLGKWVLIGFGGLIALWLTCATIYATLKYYDQVAIDEPYQLRNMRGQGSPRTSQQAIQEGRQGYAPRKGRVLRRARPVVVHRRQRKSLCRKIWHAWWWPITASVTMVGRWCGCVHEEGRRERQRPGELRREDRGDGEGEATRVASYECLLCFTRCPCG
ncbi:hypothetical protein FPQ18DRAFT_334934 [Pyronema domesticum]|nr:hypothetical protein FPQ18DRAFT_334934 [Pyronema domesticum]